MKQRFAVGVTVLVVAGLALGLLARYGMVGTTGRDMMDGAAAMLGAAAPARPGFIPASTAAGSDPDTVAVRRWLHDQVRGSSGIAPAKLMMAMDELETDPATPQHLLLFYSRRSVPIAGSGTASTGDWRVERLWPAGRGFAEMASPAYNDLHNLRLDLAGVLAERDGRDFAVHGDDAAGLGFEPADRIKGDVARSLFYMDVRYEGEGGEPDLRLIDGWTRDGEPRLGRLCTLLAWNDADPVDGDERRRNTRVERYQGNRNPFIDHPEFARVLWGRRCR